MSRFSVVVPAYNEEKTIEKVVRDILAVPEVHRCLVVDNNSSDKTSQVVEGLLPEFGTRLELVRCAEQGKGHAFKAGVARCIDDEFVGLIDADDTYPAQAFSNLLAAARRDRLDMVVGNRFEFGGYQRSNKRPGHIAGNQAISRFVRFISGVEVQDALSGLRVFSRRFLETFQNRADGFQLETEFSVHCGKTGLRYRELPIEFLDRPADNPSKLNTLRDGYRILKFAIFNSALSLTSRLGFMFGLCSVLVGGALGVRVIWEYLSQGRVTAIALAVAAALFLIVGAQFVLFSGVDSRLRRIERALLK
ncbi:glycosyltransferase family 2 protein [Pseudomarimonas salicorniae]|uniref:Glycosyltransferase family 2 protein n=1 Tax=Pseudomarimonas salicorniae TaxID=2933270 RepID=A0ABT0GIU7_9GAMM|nr:glycosyltransferase family 2 protein [Lysobacter sp. CAU 1642]MCK7594466.1 glycosyltransferase family 2 protein [Lysobacter sp. CAU 1642]